MVIRRVWRRNASGGYRGPYIYEYRSVRDGDHVRSEYVRYIGHGPTAPREALMMQRDDRTSNLSRSLDLYRSGREFVAWDLETTGLSPEDDAPIEICAYRCRVGRGEVEFIEKWSTLVNPGRPIPGMISAKTHIYDDMVRDAPCVEDAYREFRRRLGTREMLGQNIGFDVRFTHPLSDRYGYSQLDLGRCVDTLALSRSLYPDAEGHKLDEIARRERVRACEGGAFHRAGTDVEVCARAWVSMCRKAENEMRR